MNIKNEWENLSRKEQAFILACFEQSKGNAAKKENNQQSLEEMHKKIQAASKRKILRRQLELLTEYSRTSGAERIPECSQAMASLYQELVKAEHRALFLPVALLGVSLGLLYGVGVKLIKFGQRQ